MITSEAEVRIALQAVLISVFALYGYWGWALLMLVILVPWKPFLMVGGYLVQPVVDWRVQKARNRDGRSTAQVERELDAILAGGKSPAPSIPPAQFPLPPAAAPQAEPRKLHGYTVPAVERIGPVPKDLSATLAIPPAIRDHVRTLPQGVFSNMDFEVEEVKFHDDTAEAYVRFQSPNVSELVIRQRYFLRKCGHQWQVESRQPANGASKLPPLPPSVGSPSLHAS